MSQSLNRPIKHSVTRATSCAVKGVLRVNVCYTSREEATVTRATACTVKGIGRNNLLQVRNTPTEKFYAIGSGSCIAKGSLYNSFYYNEDYYTSIENALYASGQYSKSVKGPYYYLSSNHFDLDVKYF